MDGTYPYYLLLRSVMAVKCECVDFFFLLSKRSHFMSWLPIFTSFVGLFLLLGAFLWSYLGLMAGLAGLMVVVPALTSEVFVSRFRRPFSFMLFLFSEAMIFATLFVTTLWFEDSSADAISDWFGLPAVGCLLLITSSVAVSVYHGRIATFGLDWIYLFLGMILGLGFIYLQLWEMWECRCDIFFCAYYSSSFSTVGLHFLHVLLGLIVLAYVFWNRANMSFYFVTLSMWYWHFVDYMWLVVYVVVYML